MGLRMESPSETVLIRKGSEGGWHCLLHLSILSLQSLI